MRIRYSKEADALYIRLRENKIIESDEVSGDLIKCLIIKFFTVSWP